MFVTCVWAVYHGAHMGVSTNFWSTRWAPGISLSMSGGKHLSHSCSTSSMALTVMENLPKAAAL